ncbi:unnamed protein product [Caenorhabditis nigoni]
MPGFACVADGRRRTIAIGGDKLKKEIRVPSWLRRIKASSKRLKMKKCDHDGPGLGTQFLFIGAILVFFKFNPKWNIYNDGMLGFPRRHVGMIVGWMRSIVLNGREKGKSGYRPGSEEAFRSHRLLAPRKRQQCLKNWRIPEKQGFASKAKVILHGWKRGTSGSLQPPKRLKIKILTWMDLDPEINSPSSSGYSSPKHNEYGYIQKWNMYDEIFSEAFRDDFRSGYKYGMRFGQDIPILETSW